MFHEHILHINTPYLNTCSNANTIDVQLLRQAGREGGGGGGGITQLGVWLECISYFSMHELMIYIF